MVHWTLLSQVPRNSPSSFLRGSKINLVTDRGTVSSVSKKMLIHFCGSHSINKHKHDSLDGIIYLKLPPNTEYIGVKIVTDWMQAACKGTSPATPLRVSTKPADVFASCSTVRALRAFGLYKDAGRIDRFLENQVFTLPLSGSIVKEIWMRFPRDGKYVNWTLENIFQTLHYLHPGEVGQDPESLKGLFEGVKKVVNGNWELKERLALDGLLKDVLDADGDSSSEESESEAEAEAEADQESRMPEFQDLHDAPKLESCAKVYKWLANEAGAGTDESSPEMAPGWAGLEASEESGKSNDADANVADKPSSGNADGAVEPKDQDVEESLLEDLLDVLADK
ncbi:hypothetical protein BCR34DRAFT_585043 [Clohesyomyces aquaticus]|uniref:Uncharacterized protein n=1 Tax=Clohesyomyces aquaticus TaxID=1231657 RepID=A0A1Y1ZYS1_9PLEO|nr:hypothetical protein BCR34DRAFT_585043 [Clohesyomyces aquaticus]